MGKVPIISVNKTDGCHIYLSKDSLDCEIVSAKSSEMNVLIVKEDGDYVSVSVSHIVLSVGLCQCLHAPYHSRPHYHLSVPPTTISPSCLPDGVCRSGTVQDRVGRNQTGHHSNRNRRIDAAVPPAPPRHIITSITRRPHLTDRCPTSCRSVNTVD